MMDFSQCNFASIVSRLNGRHREGGKGRGLLFTHRFSLSCSSPKYTRDEISLSLSDAYGNQVYAPRLDDPRSKTFKRCLIDTYEISGSCTY
ncbi:hypothetical protein F8388_003900 [Cannabis sativa]|uniref:Uncharacterized protein n=1 Tax=Cannabis sativa TaxID=3483 RepID=A0A7J6GNS6_CANSA|nr:hypothetical protein F8388_003900 [Cannabis sativa]